MVHTVRGTGILQQFVDKQQFPKKWLETLTPHMMTGSLSDCAALAVASNLYDSVDDALHRLVRVSNQRGRDLEALGRLASLLDKLDKVCLIRIRN